MLDEKVFKFASKYKFWAITDVGTLNYFKKCLTVGYQVMKLNYCIHIAMTINNKKFHINYKIFRLYMHANFSCLVCQYHTTTTTSITTTTITTTTTTTATTTTTTATRTTTTTTLIIIIIIIIFYLCTEYIRYERRYLKTVSWGKYLDPRQTRMVSREGFTMGNFIVFTVHLI